MRLAQSSRFLYCTWILFHFTEIQVWTIWKYSEGQIGVFSSAEPGDWVLLRFCCSFIAVWYCVCFSNSVQTSFSFMLSVQLFRSHQSSIFLAIIPLPYFENIDCFFGLCVSSQWAAREGQAHLRGTFSEFMADGEALSDSGPQILVMSRLQVADRYLGKGLVPQNKGSLSHGSKFWFCFCAQGNQIVHSFLSCILLRQRLLGGSNTVWRKEFCTLSEEGTSKLIPVGHTADWFKTVF